MWHPCLARSAKRSTCIELAFAGQALRDVKPNWECWTPDAASPVSSRARSAIVGREAAVETSELGVPHRLDCQTGRDASRPVWQSRPDLPYMFASVRNASPEFSKTCKFAKVSEDPANIDPSLFQQGKTFKKLDSSICRSYFS